MPYTDHDLYGSLAFRPKGVATLDSGHRIIVAVDFGTTYSGVSFADSTRDNVDEITVMNRWPGPGRIGDGQWKTPSRIAYAAENPQKLSKDVIGYEVLPQYKAYSWMKLLLDKHTALTEFDDPDLPDKSSGMLSLPPGKSAKMVVTDYLRLLCQFAMRELRDVFSEEVIGVTGLDFYFTVPAIWSDAARAATLEAAREAGFASRSNDSISLVPEPEAAGVATLKHLTHKGSEMQIRPGDSVIICDCGGGTVDITTYEITSISPNLEFGELVVGDGGKCGSTFIDRQFHAWMIATFGSAFRRLSYEKTAPGSKFMKEFEGFKRDFEMDKDDEQYEIDLVLDAPDSRYYDESESMVRFTGREMAAFFSPVVLKIQGLLEQQVKLTYKNGKGRKINRLILVGGFADSLYLRGHLRKWCEARNIRLICPTHPQAAIVKGAALRGLENLAPTKRLLRRHYGYEIGMEFREGIDDEANSWYSRWTGEKMCNRMSWKLKKGQDVDKETCVTSSVFETTNLEGDTLPYEYEVGPFDLHCCPLDSSPDYSKSIGVTKVGQIVGRVPGYEMSKFPTKQTPDGKTVCKVSVDIEVKIASEEGVLKFRLLSNYREIGTASIEYVT